MDSRAQSLRQGFLDYFNKHGHQVVKSSSLVPQNDPTLMFTNAGMVQFKDVFTGQETRAYKRAATAQKCMRVSGKHNDLEEVGRTARHHTFFEMLGNFSFGDYFKPEAIELAWKLITKEWGLDKDRLWVTVFGGEKGLPADTEARELWKKISGLPESRILNKGMKDNFWSMGDTGPCGPCTEIHFNLQGSGDAREEDFDNGKVVEIWNNVFMQFERKAGGELIPLPAPSVDTGMGLERVAAIVQGQSSNYHSDLFAPLLASVQELSGKKYERSPSEDDVSMRVIADHARTTAFLVADGVQPSNEGRGYVMRRIMRRAIRHGKRLGMDDLFMNKVCDVVVTSMGAAYPELNESRALIGKVAELEEKNFRRTLDTGLKILGDEIATTQKSGKKSLPGAAVFKLYDTYGFPKDLTEVIAQERGLGIDEAGFDAEMAAQQERSRGADVGDAAVSAIYKELRQKLGEVTFIGYPHEDTPLNEREGEWRRQKNEDVESLEARSLVLALVQDGAAVESVAAGQVVEVVLNPTPFYGESGGQVGDYGLLETDTLRAEVTTTTRPTDGLTVSKVRVLKGTLKRGDHVWAGYVPFVRRETRSHHSATHLLHGALRKVLGEHVKQAGSLVDPDHLRFDYSHFEAPTAEQLLTVENDANRRVKGNHPVVTEVLPFEEAKQKGAIAFFGDKYGDIVRVISMGESVEFCGGTHAKNTGDIGLVLITREEAVASGVRRMEAEVGEAARRTTRKNQARLQKAVEILRGGNVDVAEGEPIVLAVQKAMRVHKEHTSELTKAGGEPVAFSASGITAPSVSREVSLEEARTVRDTWTALVQMTNARGGQLEAMAEQLVALDKGGLLRAFAKLLSVNKENDRKVEQNKRSALTQEAGTLLEKARDVAGIKVLATRMDGLDSKALRELVDQLRNKIGSGVVCVGGEADGKASILVAVTKDLTDRVQAGKLVSELAPIIGGRGGGKPDFAQAGGQSAAALDQVFTRLYELVGK